MSEEIFEISAMRYSLDWVDSTKHSINLKDVWGLVIHFRCNDWHIEVKTKTKIQRCKTADCIWGEGYYSYELDHWVNEREVARIIASKKFKIIQYNNTHSSDKFNEAVLRLLTKAKELEAKP